MSINNESAPASVPKFDPEAALGQLIKNWKIAALDIGNEPLAAGIEEDAEALLEQYPHLKPETE